MESDLGIWVLIPAQDYVSQYEGYDQRLRSLASDLGLNSYSGLSPNMWVRFRGQALCRLIWIYNISQYVGYDQSQSSMASDLSLHSCSGLSVQVCRV